MSGNRLVYVSDDPEKAFERDRALRDRMRSLLLQVDADLEHAADCTAGARQGRAEERPDCSRSLAPEEAVKASGNRAGAGQITTLHLLFMNEAGCPMSIMREHMELFASKVMPEFR